LARAPLVAAACLTTAAAFALTAFFFAAKHQPGIASIAPFGQGPYDAVGSFGFQLALAAAALSLLRALRGYDGAGIPVAAAALILRGSVVALLAVFVTIQADAVGLLRHPRVWAHSPIGSTLAVGLVIVALATLAGAALLGSVLRRLATDARPSWARGVAAAAAGILLLAIYPEVWRRAGVMGAIGTVLFGMVALLGEVWALALAIAPETAAPADDLLDDLGALVGRRNAAPNRATRWLRGGPWRFAAVVAVMGGGTVALSQAIGEGLPGEADRAVLVVGVFTGLEAAAILLGGALFRAPLALLRAEPAPAPAAPEGQLS
jgi:hypothetical protein